MDINAIINELNINQPKTEWDLLWFFLNCDFPHDNLFAQSFWGSWLSKIEEGEKKDEEYFAKREQEIELFNKNRTIIQNDSDPADFLNDEIYDSYILSNNIYAALVVSIWSKCEQALKKISSLCVAQLKCKPPNRFDFKSQGDFFKKEFNINIENLPSYPVFNSIRIINNTYKHLDGQYNLKDRPAYDIIPRDVKVSWSIVEEQSIDYTAIPIKTLITHCRTFIYSLYSAVYKSVAQKWV